MEKEPTVTITPDHATIHTSSSDVKLLTNNGHLFGSRTRPRTSNLSKLMFPTIDRQRANSQLIRVMFHLEREAMRDANRCEHRLRSLGPVYRGSSAPSGSRLYFEWSFGFLANAYVSYAPLTVRTTTTLKLQIVSNLRRSHVLDSVPPRDAAFVSNGSSDSKLECWNRRDCQTNYDLMDVEAHLSARPAFIATKSAVP